MAIWCRILSRRLHAPITTDTRINERIAALGQKVDALSKEMIEAGQEADREADRLARASSRADDRIGRMEILLASLEDLEAEAADRLRDEETSGPSPLPSFRAARNHELGAA
ncbi:hypothetical protein JSE7799_03397 [Jannaschia seosinensis]|uniref:Uncharacterized protein n=1 Tax=Jannaschia seosinensis TaxID=313367 RepID=A0A0M7BFU9_9RHOB|nr:hypothetical protein [Jannaschia seosinensis]CUH40662.1 hypothetical protein JSE7799_03397 [Jannaschia seosinensis]